MAPRQARLDDYAQAHPPKHNGKCRTCALPPDILNQVNAHLAAQQTAKKIILDWLAEVGHPLTYPQLSYHEFSGHARKA